MATGGVTGFSSWGTDSLGGDGGRIAADAIHGLNQGARTGISDIADE